MNTQSEEEKLSNIKIVHKIAVWLFVVFLPVINNYNCCFTGLTANIFSCITLSLLVSGIVIHQQDYSCRRSDLFVCLFFIWYIIRCLTSSIACDFFVFSGIISMVMLYFWIRNASMGDTVFHALFVAGIIQAAWGILQLTGILPSYHVYFKQTGSFNNPSLWGIYLAMSLFSGVYLSRGRANVAYRIFIYTGLSFLAVGLALAQSRAAWIALACGLSWVFFFSRRALKPGKSSKQAVVLYVVIFLLVLFALWGLYLVRPESVKGRLLVYLVSFSMVKIAPWFGHGVSSFEAMYMPRQALWFQAHPDSGFNLIAGNNHFAFNEYMKFACETGIVGVALFGLLIFYTIYRVKAASGSTCYSVGLFIMIGVFGMFGYPFANLPITYVFYTTIAIIANQTKPLHYSLHLPKFSRYLGVVVLWIGMLVSWKEFRVRESAESALREVSMERKSIRDPFFTRHYPRLASSTDFVLCFAEMLYTGGFYREAIPVLEQACKRRSNELVLNSLGLCYQHEGEYDKAAEAFMQASRMTPAYILPRFHLFSLYRETGEEEKARRVAAEALSMQVKMVNTSVLRARHDMRTYLKTSR